MIRPRIELLYFAGCPHYAQTREVVERVAADLQMTPEIELVRVSGWDAAIAQRFLGSPTIRIDGRDVEPGADERRDFALACRVYWTDRGRATQPDKAWIRASLARAQ